MKWRSVWLCLATVSVVRLEVTKDVDSSLLILWSVLAHSKMT